MRALGQVGTLGYDAAVAYLLSEATQVRALASGRSDLTVEVRFLYMSLCLQAVRMVLASLPLEQA